MGRKKDPNIPQYFQTSVWMAEESCLLLDALAEHWGTSQTSALQRAIDELNTVVFPGEGQDNERALTQDG